MIDPPTIFNLSLLCSLAFCAGLIDSVVEGGGLIQIPALFNVLYSIAYPWRSLTYWVL
jgi:hypothetical protein